MKKLKIALLVSGMVCVGAAQANFDGFAAGIGAGATYVKYKVTDYDNGYSSYSGSKTKAHVYLDLNYTMPVMDDFLIGAGATYNINNIKVNNNGDEFKIKNHFSIYATPGYLITPDMLGYVKLAFHRAKFGDSDGLNRNGFGFGAGVAYALAPNMELGGEIQQILFKKKNFNESDDGGSAKIRTTEFSVTLKYRF